jgi:DNA-binding NtrC family response regulator
MVAAGRVREDLYFRLNVLRLPLPPLRDRGDDVVLLAQRFLQDAVRPGGRPLRLSPAAVAAIRAGRWPGNVRQLQNEMQRLVALCDGPEIGANELSPDIRPAS